MRRNPKSLPLRLWLFLLCSFIPQLVTAQNQSEYGFWAGDAMGDWQALDSVTERASVVALGESIHTSGGYYDAKLRMIHHLVSQKGFRAVAIESPWSEAEVAQNYIANGTGSALEALKSLFGVWNDTATLELIEWLRKWNINNPRDQVSFFGFDTQQSWADIRVIEQYFEEHTVRPGPIILDRLMKCYGARHQSAADFYRSTEYQRILDGDFVFDKHCSECEQGLVDLTFVLNRDPGHDEIFQRAMLASLSLRAYHYQMANRGLSYATGQHKYETASWLSRDSAMAVLFSLQLNRLAPLKRAIIWAHNAHIGRTYNAFAYDASPPRVVPTLNMGSFLSKRYGNKYVPIFLLSYDTGIDWPGMNAPQLPLSQDYAEVSFNGAKYPFMMINTAANSFIARNEAVNYGGEFLINGALSPGAYGVLSKQCDAVFFMQQSRPRQRVN